MLVFLNAGLLGCKVETIIPTPSLSLGVANIKQSLCSEIRSGLENIQGFLLF